MQYSLAAVILAIFSLCVPANAASPPSANNYLATQAPCTAILWNSRIVNYANNCSADQERFSRLEIKLDQVERIQRLDMLKITRFHANLVSQFESLAQSSVDANHLANLIVERLMTKLQNPSYAASFVEKWSAPRQSAEQGESTLTTEKEPELARDLLDSGCSILIGGVYKTCNEIIDGVGFTNGQRALAFTRRGGIYGMNHQFDLSSSDYKEAYALVPKSAVTNNNLAVVYCRMKDWNNCLKYLDAATTLNPKYILGLRGRAHVLFLRHDWTGAVNAFKATLAISPDDANSWIGLGRAYHNQGNETEALSAFQTGLSHDPNNAFALNSFCFQSAVLNINLDRALIDCETARSIFPTNVHFEDSLGFALYRAGKLDVAERAFARALAIDKDFAPSLYMRGIIEGRLGNDYQSTLDIRRAVELSPNIAETYEKYGLSQ